MAGLSIKRRRLGEQVFELLAARIRSGQYAAESHLSEQSLCDDLQVSRTPVREALFRLTESGLVDSRPNRGFFVARLNPKKVAENYPILGALEALALRLSPPIETADIKRLERANKKVTAIGGSGKARLLADMKFHELLTSRCTNQSLLDLIAKVRDESQRWDGGVERGMVKPDLAQKEHDEIISVLGKRQSDAAARALEKHWRGGIETVTAWIEEQNDANE